MGASSASSTDPWISNQKVTSAEARLALGATWGKQVGSSILSESGVVEGQGPSASVSSGNVLVTAHQAVCEAALGTYVCTSTATMTVPIDTPFPTSGQSRFDIIYGEIVDSADSATYRLNTVKGTASASPSAPSAPANTVPLFRVPVTNAGPQTPVAIMGWARAVGASRLVETGDTRAGGYTGERRKFRNGREDVWTGSAWLTVTAPTSWTQDNADLYFRGTGGGGTGPAGTADLGPGATKFVKWKLTGKDLEFKYIFKVGSGSAGIGMGSGEIYTTLPGGMTSAGYAQWFEATLWVIGRAGVNNAFYWPGGRGVVPANSNQVSLYFPRANNDMQMLPYLVAVTPGVPNQSVPYVAGGFSDPGEVTIYGKIEVQ